MGWVGAGGRRLLEYRELRVITLLSKLSAAALHECLIDLVVTVSPAPSAARQPPPAVLVL